LRADPGRNRNELENGRREGNARKTARISAFLTISGNRVEKRRT
jgi:hypothetical protein